MQQLARVYDCQTVIYSLYFLIFLTIILAVALKLTLIKNSLQILILQTIKQIHFEKV